MTLMGITRSLAGRILLVSLFVAGMSGRSLAQTWTETVYSDVVGACAAPIQASDGNLYVLQGCGTFYKVTTDGQASVFFTAPDGVALESFLQGTDGNFYGISDGGIFRLTLSGTFTILYSFNPDTFQPAYPPSGLIQGTDGNFYGVGTAFNGNGAGAQAIYRISPAGDFSLVYIEQNSPYEIVTGLVQATDGNFYGYGCGVFRLTPLGTYTQLTPCSSGQAARTTSPMVIGADGALYGAYEVQNYETSLYQSFVIRVTLDGSQSLVATFPGNTEYGFFLASDGNFYSAGDAVYQVTPGGIVKNIHTFSGVDGDGTYANTSVIQANNGELYGGTDFPMPESPSNPGPLYSLAATPALSAPVEVSVYPANVAPGQSATLVWNATNAYSATMQQCFASSAWSGLQHYFGSQSVSQSATGTYTYALTCGGVETGLATLTVGSGSASAATVAANPNPVSEGQAVTLTAAVSPKTSGATPTGMVQFLLGTRLVGMATLSSGSASYSASTVGISPGSYSLTAVYGGDATYAGVTSAPVTLTVSDGQASTQTALAISTNTPYLGGPVTLTATVTPSYGAAPTGEVTFNGAGQQIAQVPLVNGVAKVSFTVPTNLTPGQYFLSASYAGNAEDSASSTKQIPVTLYTPTAVTMTASPNPIVQGNLIQMNAYLTNGASGTVDFRVGSDTVATATASTGLATAVFATNGAPLGTYTVKAYYLGGGLVTPAVSPGVSVTVIPQGSLRARD